MKGTGLRKDIGDVVQYCQRGYTAMGVINVALFFKWKMFDKIRLHLDSV